MMQEPHSPRIGVRPVHGLSVFRRPRATWKIVAISCGVLFCLGSMPAGSAKAQGYGPARPDDHGQASRSFFDMGTRWWANRPHSPDVDWRAYGSRSYSHPWSDQPDEDESIDRVSGEEYGPHIPEPMVFDLVRPLGAKRGEVEVNTLGLVPLRRRTVRNGPPDPLGVVRRTRDREAIEWAPEIEYAIRDNFAVEFELPMQDGHLEAYKGAAQVTFGTAFDHRFIHGAQTIVQYDIVPKVLHTTWLYLAGLRLNETWTVFGMFGSRHELGGDTGGRRVEVLSNVSLFADVTDRIVAGVETNYGQVLDRSPSLLVMPQIHAELSAFWMLQAGVGARFTSGLTVPEVGFRLIREF